MKFIRYIAKFIITALFLVVVLDALLVFGIAHWRPAINHADAAIVLGAAINTPALYNRTTEALKLYNDHKVDTMVLSGGKIAETDISEAQYMQRVINKNSPTPANYILEDQSHNTYENIKNSQAKLLGKPDVVIVSDQFHLARGVIMAYRSGFKHVYWSAPIPSYYSDKELRYYYFRELVAMISYIPKFIKG